MTVSENTTHYDFRGLSPEQLLEMYRSLHRARRYFEVLTETFKEGKIPGALHPGDGHEGISIGVVYGVGPRDYITPSHRSHYGMLRTRGVPWRKIFAECMGKKTGISRGRRSEGVMGTFDDQYRVWPSNPVLGHAVPQATGSALALKIQKRTEIHLVCVGDGASAAGTTWEACHFAGIYKLPVVIVVENNGYAYSTAFARMSPVPNVADRAAAFGFPGVVVDGTDVLAVRAAVSEAAERARAGLGPTLVECKAYRFHGHFIGDPEVYRDKAEVQAARQRDPVKRYRELLLAEGIATAAELENIHAENETELREAVRQALEDPYENPEDLLDWPQGAGYNLEGYST